MATQAAVDAATAAVTTLEEAQRVTAQHEVERTVLHSDAMEVDARLAKARYELSVAEGGLATEREHLNQLLGRDISTAFRVEPLPEDDAPALSLQDARDRAAQNRPEIRIARLKHKLADVDRRIAKAEYIPNLSFSIRYLGMNNVEVLPQNVATAGFLLTWEPFDWGRRHNAIAEKEKTVEQASNGIREAESKIAVEVGMKYRKWQDSALLLKATRMARDAAAEQLRITRACFKNRFGLTAGTYA